MNTVDTRPIKMSYEIFAVGLDQLYFTPLLEDETIHDRCLAIDRYIELNGWSWDLIIEQMSKLEIDINNN